MEILRDIKQIEDSLKNIFVFKEDFNFEHFISEKIEINEILSVSLKGNSQENILININLFSDLLFQLKVYIFALSNFVRLLLHCNLQLELYNFVKRLFIGQIGQIKYVSTKQAYSFDEKFFDRFVEIVKNCEIEKELYLPFVLTAFESDKSDKLYVWKRPAIEFMQRFFNENEAWTLEYLSNHKEQKYSVLAMITDFNTPRGIKMLFDDFTNNGDCDETKIAHLLKKYKRETFFEVDKRLVDPSHCKQDLVRILFMFGLDTEAVTRLKEIYEHETDEDLKMEIAERLDIMQNVSTKTEKQFLYTVRRKVKDVQERTLGLPFDRLNLTYKGGQKADNATYTYIINLFKEEKNLYNLKNLEYVLDIFETETLYNFASSVFETLKKKEDIKAAKWAVRMASLFSSENGAKKLSNFSKELLELGRVKEAKYLIECLCYSGKIEILDVFKSSLVDKIQEENWKENITNVLIKKSGMGKDILDDYCNIGRVDNITYEQQKERLFYAFINDRRYTFEYFDFISKLEPYRTLFERLVWGEYRFGRLNNAFVMKNGEKQYLVELSRENIIISNESEKSEFNIGIIHSLDIDERFEKVLTAVPNPLFNQFKYGKNDVKNFPIQISELNIFAGMFVLVDTYVEKMKECGFVKNVEINNQTFSSFINLNKDLNMACIVHLDRPVLKDQKYSVLSSICFYKMSDLIENNGKFTYNVGDMLTLGSLPSRYFDYCLTCILACAK